MIDYTHPDCYRAKAIITKRRRAASNKRGKQLIKQLQAYQVAFNEARKAGLPLPSVSDFTTPKPEPDGALQEVIDYGAETQELIDAREDEEFWRSGQW